MISNNSKTTSLQYPHLWGIDKIKAARTDADQIYSVSRKALQTISDKYEKTQPATNCNQLNLAILMLKEAQTIEFADRVAKTPKTNMAPIPSLFHKIGSLCMSLISENRTLNDEYFREFTQIVNPIFNKVNYSTNSDAKINYSTHPMGYVDYSGNPEPEYAVLRDIVLAERIRIQTHFKSKIPYTRPLDLGSAQEYQKIANEALDKSATEARNQKDARDIKIGVGVVLLAGAVAAKIIAPTKK